MHYPIVDFYIYKLLFTNCKFKFHFFITHSFSSIFHILTHSPLFSLFSIYLLFVSPFSLSLSLFACCGGGFVSLLCRYLSLVAAVGNGFVNRFSGLADRRGE